MNILTFEENVPIPNTFQIKCTARKMLRLQSKQDAYELFQNRRIFRDQLQIIILGGGSNILFTKPLLEDLVIKVEIKGRKILRETHDAWILEVGAGEMWDDLVQWTIQQGLPGLENLALIPGTVGAAIVQNIGAYGVELKKFFHSVDCINTVTGAGVTLDAGHCLFGYRDSTFKHQTQPHLITSLCLALPKVWKPVLKYKDLATLRSKNDLTALELYTTIANIRRAKLPDPALFGNLGSYFKNPTVSIEEYDRMKAKDPNIVGFYPTGQPAADAALLSSPCMVKLSAGWMIEACGWKGKSMGNVGVSDQHALVLINLGNASGAEVERLALAVQESVRDRFGINLEREAIVL